MAEIRAEIPKTSLEIENFIFNLNVGYAGSTSTWNSFHFQITHLLNSLFFSLIAYQESISNSYAEVQPILSKVSLAPSPESQ